MTLWFHHQRSLRASPVRLETLRSASALAATSTGRFATAKDGRVGAVVGQTEVSDRSAPVLALRQLGDLRADSNQTARTIRALSADPRSESIAIHAALLLARLP